jgi:hypothetical protein
MKYFENLDEEAIVNVKKNEKKKEKRTVKESERKEESNISII